MCVESIDANADEKVLINLFEYDRTMDCGGGGFIAWEVGRGWDEG